MKFGIFSLVTLLVVPFTIQAGISNYDETYKCGKVKNPGTRMARIVSLDPYAIDEMTYEPSQELKDELKNLDVKGPSAGFTFEDGYSIFSDLVDVGGNSYTFLTLADESFGSVSELVLPEGVKLVESVDVTKILKANRNFFREPIVFKKANIGEINTSDTLAGKLGKGFTYLGYATFAYQVGSLFAAASEGEKVDEQVYAVIKNIANTAVSKLGTAGLQLAFVGVFAIDYSLSNFAKEAQAQHTDNIREIYTNYTYKRRKMPEWYKVLDKKVKEELKDGSTTSLTNIIEQEIRSVAQKFWNDNDSAIETLRLEKWPSADEQKKLTDEMVLSLKCTMSQTGVFKRINDNIIERLRNEAVKKEEEVARQYNKKMVIEVKPASAKNGGASGKGDAKNKYAGYTVFLRPVIGSGTPWSFKLDDAGMGKIDFTVLGFFQCGCPRVCEIYAPDKVRGKDKPEWSFKFPVSDPLTTIVLAEGEPIYDGTYELTSQKYLYKGEKNSLTLPSTFQFKVSGDTMTITAVGAKSGYTGKFDPKTRKYSYSDSYTIGSSYKVLAELTFTGSGDDIKFSGYVKEICTHASDDNPSERSYTKELKGHKIKAEKK